MVGVGLVDRVLPLGKPRLEIEVVVSEMRIPFSLEARVGMTIDVVDGVVRVEGTTRLADTDRRGPLFEENSMESGRIEGPLFVEGSTESGLVGRLLAVCLNDTPLFNRFDAIIDAWDEVDVVIAVVVAVLCCRIIGGALCGH